MAAATFFELNSFLGKFSQLCNFGFNASLTFKNHNGNIIANIEAEIGSCNSSQLSSNQGSSKSCKNTKPSQVRRRNKRKTAHSNTSSSEMLNSNNFSSLNLAADIDGIDKTTSKSNSSPSIDIDARDDKSNNECFIEFDQGSHILVTEHDHSSSELFHQQECLTSSKITTDDPRNLKSVNDTCHPNDTLSNGNDSLSTAMPEPTSEVLLPVNQNDFYHFMEDFRKSLNTTLENALSSSLSGLT